MNSTITLITPSGEHITVTPDDNSCRVKSLDGSDTLKICYSLKEPREVPIGTTAIYRGDTYTLESQSDLQMMHTELYNYTLKLTAPSGRLANYIVANQVDGRTDFPLTATPAEHLQLIIDNLNSRESGWSIGDIITDEATKLIHYTNTNCKAALEQIAEEFHTELYIDGKVISIATNDQFKNDALPLSYGQGNGLLSDIKRVTDSETPISTLYVVSSDRNIDPTKYGAKTLRMPKSFTSGEFVTNSRGTSVRFKSAPKGSPEGVAELTQVYPSRVGVVSKVESPKEGLFDFLDSSIPDTLNFKEATIPGQSITIIFQTGMLAGRELEANYVHKDRRFQIVPKEEDGITLPSGVFIPKVGDKYAVFNCELPDEYVKQAEQDLLNKAIELLKERNEQKVTIVAQVDSLFAKKRWGEIEHKLKVGRWVSFTDPKWNPTPTLIQIQSVTEWLTNPYSPKIELSNTPTRSGKVTELIKEVKQSEVKRREQKEALIKLQDRTYKDTEAVREMVEKLKVEGFSKSLKPETLQTMYAVIGSPALQFEFVGGGFSWTEGKGGVVTIPRQTIRQRVAGTTLEPEPKTVETTIPALTYTLKPDEQQAHIYVELKPTPRYVVSTKPLEITPDRLLVGLLNGTEGSRGFTPLYGFTEISPSHIATRYIRSRSGNMLIDLETGNIYSDKIEFRRPDGSAKDIDQVISEEVQVGGRNLFIKSKIIYGQAVTGTVKGGTVISYNGGEIYYMPVKAGEVYTLTRSGEYNATHFDYGFTRTEPKPGVDVSDGKYKRIGLVAPSEHVGFEVPYDGWILLYLTNGVNKIDDSKPITLGDIKLERGTVATDWTPAPEDVQADIEAVERGYQKLIERVDVEFAISNSRDIAPTSGWQTNAPTPARGQALWQRTKVYLKDGTTEVRGVTCIQGKDGLDGKDGAKGGDGADGRGIAKIVELYYLSSSNTALANGAWSETAPTPKEGFWIWTKTRIHYTTGEHIETQPICVTGNKGDRGERGLQGLQGKDGANGLPGRDGVDGKTSYTHIAYADTATGGGFSQSPTGKAYIGMYVDFVQADSSDPKKYAWSLIKGADGKNGLNGKDGVPGKPGADGRTPYLHIAYANSQDGKQGFSVSVSEGKSYIGTYTDYTQADSTDPTKYSWSRIKGEKGDRGADGAKGEKGDGLDIKDTRNDNQPPSWYRKNYPLTTVREFKLQDVIEIPSGWRDGSYCMLETTVKWAHTSGGRVTQKATLNSGQELYRVGSSDDSKWEAWSNIKAEMQEINAGLTSATSMIDTLQKAQQALDNGLLDKADTKDINYLLRALKDGSTQIAGGLLLSNDIILSDPNSKDVTAMISGSQTGGAKAMRLGITYTCDHDKKTTVSGANAKWGVNLYAEVQAIENPDDSKRIAKINELGFAIVGGRDHDWTRWEVCKRADLQDVGEATAFNNNGTGHIGELFFNGDYIGFGTEQQRYMTIGGVARTEQEMNEASTTIKEFEIPSGYVDDRNSSVVLERWESAEGNRQLIFKVPITASCRCELIPSERQDGGSTNPSVPSQGGDTVYESNSVSVSVWAELEMRRGGRLIKTYKTTEVKASASVQGGSFPEGGPAFMSRNDSKSATQTITVPPEEVQKGDEWTLLLKCYGSGRRYAYYNGRTSGGTSLIPYDNSKPLISITDSKAAFFYGRQKQVLLNYASEVLKVIGNAIFQGDLNVKGTVTADSYQGNGMPLAGATFDSSGSEVKALGRYKNKRNSSFASAGYSYSTKSFTVYHSIPHDRYIPLVNPFNDPASPVISDVSAYSFKVRFTLQSERYDGWAVGFSYIAFQTE